MPSRSDNTRLRRSRRCHGMKGRLRSAFPSEEGHRKRNPEGKAFATGVGKPIYVIQTSSTSKRPARRWSLHISRRGARSLKTAKLRQLEKGRWPRDRNQLQSRSFIVCAWRSLERRTDHDGRKPDHHRQSQDDPETLRAFSLFHPFGFRYSQPANAAAQVVEPVPVREILGCRRSWRRGWTSWFRYACCHSLPLDSLGEMILQLRSTATENARCRAKRPAATLAGVGHSRV
jgi:hypothetical protein